ncbi:MAG: DUF4258 domain-containing protein [Actinobacteria bacterium]|nr:DUF4258 domain-containing protein [Actinomycetota bacterium]
MKKIIFSDHSIEKMKILNKHGFQINKKAVVNIMKNPDTIISGYKHRKIAQKIIDNKHFIRVIFMEDLDSKKIVTVYPAKRSRYENQV